MGENERGLMMVIGEMMTTEVSLHHLFSPHLASPEGEGQIHLTAWLSMAYQIRSNLHHPVFDITGVTCISPTGENERGLMMIIGVTSHLQFSPHLTSPEGEGQIHLTG